MRGPPDRLVFEAFVDHELVPMLRPGQIVVLDDLSVHKSAHARAAIEAVGARLCFLPTYSPDFNPIAMIFAKLKGLLRRAEARTRDHLIDATRDAISDITTRDARTC